MDVTVNHDRTGKPVSVTLPFERWLELDPENAETYLSDEEIYDRAIARKEAGEEYFPAELVNRLCTDESPVKIYREYRGLKQKYLAERADITAKHLSQIENNKATMSAQLQKILAAILNVDVDDLDPYNPDEE